MAIQAASLNAWRGIGLMSLAMLSIPMVDGLAKYLSSSYSPLYISWSRYAVAALLIVPIACLRFGRTPFPQNNLRSHVLRTVFLVSAMTLFFVAISITPLATAMSAYFIGPVIASLLAVRFLGEQLTRTKITALTLGFIGAIIVVNPGTSIEPGVLLALASGVCFACYLVTTRQASQNTSPLKTLAFQCSFGAVLLLPQALVFWSLPAREDWPLFAAMGALSLVSHFLSIAAFRYAEASTLSPLVYLELLSATAIGYIFFHELPAAHVWFGAVFIVLSGLLLLASNKTNH